MTFITPWMCIFSVCLLTSTTSGQHDDLVVILKGEKLELHCPKYVLNEVAYDPIFTFKPVSADESLQFAFGKMRRYESPSDLKIEETDEKTFIYSFDSATSRHAGDYGCHERGIRDYKVTVFDPSALSCPDLPVVTEGAYVEASCVVNKTGPSTDWPENFFRLMKADDVVGTSILDDGETYRVTTLNDSLRFSRSDHGSTLVMCEIPSLKIRCESNVANVTWFPSTVEVSSLPSFVRRDAEIPLSCEVDDLGHPVTMISVESNHEALISNVTMDNTVTSFTFVAANMPKLSNASITCLAGKVSKTVEILVAEGPDSVRPDKEEIRVVAGDVFGVTCKSVDSNPPALISYSFDGEPISDHLSIVALAKMHGRAISCQARNPLTKTSSPIAEIPIEVTFIAPKKPHFNRVEFTLGEDLFLACPFHGFPSPSYTWTFGLDVNASLRFPNDVAVDAEVVGSEALLHVTNASGADAGFYTCVARNLVGAEVHSVELNLVETENKNEIVSMELDDFSTMAMIVPVVLVVIVLLVAALVAFFLRRKATGGKLDLEKGNAKIRAVTPLLDTDLKLGLSSQDGATGDDEMTEPASIIGESDSFIVTETDRVTVDGDMTKDDSQDTSFIDDQELHPGDERL